MSTSLYHLMEQESNLPVRGTIKGDGLSVLMELLLLKKMLLTASPLKNQIITSKMAIMVDS